MSVYHALSPRHNKRIRVKAAARRGRNDRLRHSGLAVGQLVREREAYDLFGILFARSSAICAAWLTDYGFRRSSAAQGFSDDRLCRGLATDDAQKRVV